MRQAAGMGCSVKNLVSQEDSRDGLAVWEQDLVVQISLPHLNCLKCGETSDIKHHKRTHGFLVVHLHNMAWNTRIEGVSKQFNEQLQGLTLVMFPNRS